jgi:hypothetical protein
MKNFIVIVSLFFTSFYVNAQTAIFNDLLQKHVDKNGFVDYQSFKKDLPELEKYIQYVATTKPEESWSANKQKAFYINAYNAYTILLILQEYPIKSIMDIKEQGKSAWKIPFAIVGGQTLTLDAIEHEILRKKFDDPRIHVGVNCASISCPKLGNIAFTEENIETELTQLIKDFVNDASRNKITSKNSQISSIFDWFKEDFTKKGTVINFLNKYSKTQINQDAKISYLTYDWNLNGK